MNKDQIKGRIDQATGKVKEEAGDLTGNKSLEEKGRAEKTAGKIRGDLGDAKEQVKDKLDKTLGKR